MAALLIVGALAIADKVEQKKEKRRQKKASDEKRYRALQVETNQRLARRESENNTSFVDEPQDSSEEDNENVKVAGSEAPPPAYEDAVQAGARKELEWKWRLQNRRRSSVQSQTSGGSEGKGDAGERYMRMG